MIDCVSVLNMRLSDQQTIQQGTSGRDLIRRAANEVYEAVDWMGNIAVVTGSGNNGADGFALACLLSENGVQPTVFKVSDRLHDDCAYFASIAESKGVHVQAYQGNCDLLRGYDMIVDCMLGTGTNGLVREEYRCAIQEINCSGAYVVSVDINSGMNGDTGEGECIVRSDLTVAIEYIKKGMITENAGRFIDKLIFRRIGIGLVKTEDYICTNGEWIAVCTDMSVSETAQFIEDNGVYYHKCPPWLVI